MKLISIFIFSILVSFNVFSQEPPLEYTKIKTCSDRSCILQDTVFQIALEEIKLNVNLYTIVNISSIVSYRDSLVVSKSAFTTKSYDVFYKTIDELYFNSYKNKVINDSKKIINKGKKLLFCYRTLTPNEDGKFLVHFFTVE